MLDTLPFAVQLSADRKYLNVRIAVANLPAELRRRPAAMNVRLLNETPPIKVQAWPRWVPNFVLALASR